MLVSIVRGNVFCNVVGTVPPTVKEFAWMLVTPLASVNPLVPPEIVKAPSLIVVPMLLENVTVPVALAVSVRF